MREKKCIDLNSNVMNFELKNVAKEREKKERERDRKRKAKQKERPTHPMS